MRDVIRKCTVCAVALMSFVFPVTPSFAADVPALESMSLEDLLFMDVSVVTAGRTEQSLSEAPAAMYVITAEDIKLLGATQLSEALIMVPGMNLRRATAANAHIGGIRGLMGLPMNKVVVLVNGMQWAADAYNDPLMAVPPVALSDIDRIEVLKGPGSSLYGSNAVTGVINIITKSLKDTKGTLLSFTGGEYNTYLGTVRNGGSIGENIDYRVTGYYNQRDNFGPIRYSHNPTQSVPSGNAAIDYRINENSSLSFLGGAMLGQKSENEFESTGVVEFDDSLIQYANVKYLINNPAITITGSWRDEDFSKEGYSFGQKLIPFSSKEGRLEVQNTLKPFARNTLVWGADATHNYLDASFASGKRYIDRIGLFFDDTYKITDWMTLNGGVRYSKNSNVTDPVLSNRVSLMLYPYSNHRIRLTQGVSYRDPSFVESYYNVRTNLNPTGTLYYNVVGHADLKPEKADSLEASYQGRVGKMGWELNAYTMNARDFIFIKTTSLWPGTVFPRVIDFVNGGEAQVVGSEVEVRYLFTEWLSGLVNYTNIYSKEVTAPVQYLVTQTPRNMANAQLTAKFKNGLTMNLTGNYVDATAWKYNASWLAGGDAPAYTIANLFVGYKVLSNLELSVAASNLFDNMYSEYPIAGVKIGRRVTGTVTYTF